MTGQKETARSGSERQDRGSGLPLPEPIARRWVALALVGCAVVAAYLMLTNLTYGLPFYYHPDEGGKLMAAAGLLRARAPTEFNHPHFMLLFSTPFIYVAERLGAHPLLGARAAVATLGVATVCLLFVVGRVLAGPPAGLAAALLYATAPLAVIAAHDYKEDIPLAFWLTVQLLFLVRYLRAAHARDLLLAAGALGIAIGTKYTGAIGVPLLIGAAWFGPAPDRKWKVMGMAVLPAAAAFLASTPSVVWQWREFLHGTLFEMTHAVFGHGIRKAWDLGGGGLVGDQVSPIAISPVSHLWT
ncbi:MAG: glycosyltransferase family 39 protein, partial [Acidobacteria bacterium]|nr:glycosyltransferase family 39 protein [Acidobacteriota bacterium]